MVLQETLPQYYSRPQCFAPKLHQVTIIIMVVREIAIKKEKSHLDGEHPSAIDTLFSIYASRICKIDEPEH